MLEKRTHANCKCARTDERTRATRGRRNAEAQGERQGRRQSEKKREMERDRDRVSE